MPKIGISEKAQDSLKNKENLCNPLLKSVQSEISGPYQKSQNFLLDKDFLIC